jgi:hypothetical protein
LTSGTIDTERSSTASLPDNNVTCSYDQYHNGTACVSCNEDCATAQNGCEYEHTDCTICLDVKCKSCDNFECTSCITGASLTDDNPDTCECIDGYYEDDNGKC